MLYSTSISGTMPEANPIRNQDNFATIDTSLKNIYGYPDIFNWNYELWIILYI